MVEIVGVEADSIANEIGLEKGDRLISINGKLMRDYIDFKYQTSDVFFILEVEKKNGEHWEIEVERNLEEKLGIIFNDIIFDNLMLCQNNCIFCFIQQQAPGLRKTLKLKDDDYRFSFLQGSFITLTNLNDLEFERIFKLNLSPLNISIHTTNPRLRERMMRNYKAGEILNHLRRLKEANINFNAQIVLCPGLNDKKELDKSINDLSLFRPNIISLGIVPVGLTKYRKGLYPLKKYDAKMAKNLLTQISLWQKKIMHNDSNWVYAADEFYYLADKDIPSYEEYDGFPQLENGIGLSRLMWNKFKKLENTLPKRVKYNKVTIITSVLGKKALKPVIKRLLKIEGLFIDLISIKNYFFGLDVTVTGLLTAGDIIHTLKNKKVSNKIILPKIAINDKGYFLDDLNLEDIKKEFPDKDFYIKGDIQGILEVLIGD
jgi:putative radical SAM enzyme (TIGR03279 family)